MNNQESIQQKIRDALASERDAISLSNQLFSPQGLFNQLATSESERRNIVETPLFKEAQHRLSVLEQKAEFAQPLARLRRDEAAVHVCIEWNAFKSHVDWAGIYLLGTNMFPAVSAGLAEHADAMPLRPPGDRRPATTSDAETKLHHHSLDCEETLGW